MRCSRGRTTRATLKRALLRECELSGTRFVESDLRDADLRGSTGYSLDLLSSRTKGLKLTPDDDATQQLAQFGIVLDYG